MHREIFKLIDDSSKRLVCLAAPRGFGKTTVIGLGLPARLALFRMAPYIVYVSASVSEAAKKVKILAQELEYNPLIRELFGSLKGVKWAEEKGEIELCDENGPFCFIQARGAGSQVRGLKWREHRPTIFIVDDLENKDEAKNEVIRKDLKSWFFSDLMGAMDNSEGSLSRLILIGTVVHQDSLLANLIDERSEIRGEDFGLDEEAQKILEEKEKFYALRLEACNDLYESCWPEFISTAAIRARAAAYKARNELDVFYMEFRNIVIATEDASFLPGMFRYFSEQDDLDKVDIAEGETIILVDPCKKKKGDGAKAAIVGVTFNQRNNKIFIRDIVNKKITHNELYQEATDMADRLGTNIIGVEVTGIEDYIIYPFHQYITQTKKKFYEIVELKATGDKEDRIRGLVPFYRMGNIYHAQQEHVKGPLETQLLAFPRGKFVDIIDALSHMIKMFDLGNRCFSRSVIELEKGKGYSVEDEYEQLKLEDKLESALPVFRIC